MAFWGPPTIQIGAYRDRILGLGLEHSTHVRDASPNDGESPARTHPGDRHCPIRAQTEMGSFGVRRPGVCPLLPALQGESSAPGASTHLTVRLSLVQPVS